MDLFREAAASKILWAWERCVWRWWHARQRLSGWKMGAATTAAVVVPLAIWRGILTLIAGAGRRGG